MSYQHDLNVFYMECGIAGFSSDLVVSQIVTQANALNRLNNERVSGPLRKALWPLPGKTYGSTKEGWNVDAWKEDWQKRRDTAVTRLTEACKGHCGITIADDNLRGCVRLHLATGRSNHVEGGYTVPVADLRP